MFNYFKKSISRQFLFIMLFMFFLSLIGGGVLTYLNARIQNHYVATTQTLQQKQMLVDKISKHLNQVFYLSRGYYAFKDSAELNNLYDEIDQLNVALDQFAHLNLTGNEQKLVIQTKDFIRKYQTVTLPTAINYVKANNYSALQKLAASGMNTTINQFLQYTDDFAKESRNNVYKEQQIFLQRNDMLNYAEIFYVLLVLVLITYSIRRISLQIGEPLKDLTLASQQMAAGETITLEHTDRVDEIGILSRSFLQMVKVIQEKEEEMSAQNEELLAQQEELSDQQERLKQSLIETEFTKNTLLRHNVFNHALSTTLHKQELLQSIIENMTKIYHMDKAMILLLDQSQEFASIGISQNIAERILQSMQDSMIIRLQETKKTHVIKRTADLYELGFHDGTLYCYDMYTPIYSKDQKLMAVFISTRIGSPFLEEEIHEITGIMNQICLSLEKIYLYEETESSRQLNQDIIDHVNEGIQFVGIDGHLLQLNQKLCEFFQWDTPDQLQFADYAVWSQRIQQSVVNGESLLTFLENAIFSNQTYGHTYRYEVEQPDKRVINIYAESIFREEKKIGTLFVHRDITEEYEIDQMKSELVSTVSHELRTPLASVLGFAELMLTKEMKPERQKKYLETIYKEAHRLTNLINDFLDLQRMESGRQVYEQREVDLLRVAEEILESFKINHSAHQFVITNHAEKTEVQGDRERIIQLYTNLIGNAVKFSPNGGTIELSFCNADNEIEVKVIDQGLGIPEKDLPKLFNKFHRIDNSDRRKIGGTGLGLAICKEIVEAHKGRIFVQSKLGEGSMFCFCMPVDTSALQLKEPQSEHIHSEALQSKKMPVLIILEDDLSLAMLLMEGLKESGFHVLHYTDAGRAAEAIQSLLPEVVVIDLLIEDRMDGWSVIESMKKDPKTANIPIIISSALDEKEKGIALGANQYLTKPYPPAKLTTVILQTLLEGKQTGEIMIPSEDSFVKKAE
ncbi:ATP-binding protein [Fodinisporobacter ferrooxydans]|uniref:histidine kinase n=1 Tax=Fodinisporobacter ferrooxydans TaxID=2901836 RepID=A0ABY4CVX8_9BACL|nr:ATP-binding protein [Alicyclobacillaceae bacterium MYW30-H2]